MADKSRIPAQFTGQQYEFDFWYALFNKLNLPEVARRFVLHIWLSQVVQYRKFEKFNGIPIPSKTLRSRLPGLEKGSLRGVVTYIPHDSRVHRCRHYRLSQNVLDDFTDFLHGISDDEFYEAPTVDLLSGHKVRLYSGVTLYDSKRNPEPEFLQQVNSCLRSAPSPYNNAAILLHLEALKKDVEIAEKAYGTNHRKYKKALRRYLNDRRCYRAIRLRTVSKGGDIWYYIPAYRVVSTGRMVEDGGGLQNCTREMKAAAYSGTGVVNYDFSSCQPTLFCRFAERDLRMSESDIRHWCAFAEAGGKEKIAEQVSIPKSLVKRCANAALFGATLPTSPKRTFHNAIQEAIAEELGAEAEDGKIVIEERKLRDGQEKVAEYLSPMIEEVQRAYPHLDLYTPPYRCRNGMVRNAVGKVAKPSSMKSGQYLAFTLQGRESHATGNVIIRTTAAGFPAATHQHDGCGVKHGIPADIIALTKQETGLTLAPKWFVDQLDWSLV